MVIKGIDMVQHDESVGFAVISAEDIDDYGIENVIAKIRERVGGGPVYLRWANNLHSNRNGLVDMIVAWT